MKRLALITCLLVALFAASNSFSAILNATKIGSVFTTTPVQEVAFQALSGFRGAFTPINIGLTVGTYVIMSTIGDGINALRVQMASPLPPALSSSTWTNGDTPPNPYTVLTQYSINYSGTYKDWASTPSQACIQGIVNNSSLTGYTCVDQGNGTYKLYNVAGTLVETLSFGAAPRCSYGYTLTGSTCTLTGGYAQPYWPFDSKPTLRPINGVLAPNSRDPDNGYLAPGNISRVGTDTYGNPVSETISTNPENGVDYVRDTQSANSSTGEPVVQRDRYSTNSSGLVTSVTSNTYNNSTVGSVNTSNTTTIAPSASTVDMTATNAKLDSINTKLAPQPFTDTEPTAARTIAASNTALYNSFKAHLPAVNMSDTVPDCPVFSAVIPFLNFTMVIDQYCSLDQYIRPVLGVASIAAYSLMGMLIVMGS